MFKGRTINHTENLLFSLKKMDELKVKSLIVLQKNKFSGILSIGDIQRAIINKISLDSEISKILRKNIRIAKTSDDFETIRKMMLKFRMELCPVVNAENEIVKVYFWEDIFAEEEKLQNRNINLPVVIMAGGKGTRMQPLTNVIPKPLIPISNKTILEEIFDNFLNVGCNDFYLSVNYKADIIKHYFEFLENNQYKISYFQETRPLGTAGSLYLIKEKINTTFFVTNCDIIINEDYAEILNYHNENKNELTVVAALKHYPIPYGTIESGKNGILKKLIEKPELTFQINTGFYILEPHLLEEIPENKFFHITHLIDTIIARKGQVGVFPVSEGSWQDIGEWSEYIKNVKSLI